jgi:hypothetical protein
VVLALAGIGAAGALAIAPLVAPFAPACLFHALTGLPCPSCGATRAVVALADGDVGRALAFNPLVTLGVLAFLAAGMAALPWVALRGPVPVEARAVSTGRLRLGVAATLAAQWAWLVIRGV